MDLKAHSFDRPAPKNDLLGSFDSEKELQAYLEREEEVDFDDIKEWDPRLDELEKEDNGGRQARLGQHESDANLSDLINEEVKASWWQDEHIRATGQSDSSIDTVWLRNALLRDNLKEGEMIYGDTWIPTTDLLTRASA